MNDSHEIFTFGSQYLRGFSPDPTQWERDMALMKSLNFNTIRIWLVWGVIEPSEGVIDFRTIDTLLDLAEKNGLRVIFLFHMHGAPEWAISKYRKCWYVDQYGLPFEPSARANTPSGGWPGLCPDHPEVQKLEENFISAVCEHVGTRAFAFEPLNEPHMWIDFARNPHGFFCFCDETRKQFRIWLKKRYNSLEALSKAWGHVITDWNDVRPPTWNFGHTDTIDWRLFTTENIAALVQRRTDIIRKHSRANVIAHAWGGGTLTCANLGAMAFDDWKNSRCLDKWGCSAFPSTLDQTCNVGLSMDSTRSAADGKEFWQSELSAGDTAGGLNRVPGVAPDTFAIWCWEAIGHGSRGLLFWQFRKELYGNESGAYGLTDYQGNPTPRAMVAAKISSILNGNADFFNHAEMPMAQVAILFSYRSFMLNWAERRNNTLSVDSLGGYYRAFWERNIPVDILHEEFTDKEKLANYKLLILPCPFTLYSKLTDLLPEFVQNGGTVLADPMTSLWDENQRLSDHVPGNGLHTLFGCQEASLRTNSDTNIILNYNGQKCNLQNSFALETWQIDSVDAQSLAHTDDGIPVIVAKRHGNGQAVISGVNLGVLFSQKSSISDDFHRQAIEQSNESAQRIILDIAFRAGIETPFSAPDNLRIRHLRTDNQDVLIIFEYNNLKTSANITFAAAQNRSWTNLQDGSTGAFSNGTTTLEFYPHETKVLLF